jgi:hypothetical protein
MANRNRLAAPPATMRARGTRETLPQYTCLLVHDAHQASGESYFQQWSYSITSLAQRCETHEAVALAPLELPAVSLARERALFDIDCSGCALIVQSVDVASVGGRSGLGRQECASETGVNAQSSSPRQATVSHHCVRDRT